MIRQKLGKYILLYLILLCISGFINCKKTHILIYASIHEAAQKGDLKDVKHHIKRGVAVNAQDENGWTPLYVVVFYG